MLIDYNFDGGTPGICEQLDAGRIRFIPYASRSGCQWFYTCLRIDGLPAGSNAVLELKWPPLWTPGDCPPGLDEEAVRRLTTYDSFALVAVNTVIQSSDMNNWQPVEGVSKRDSDNSLLIPLKHAENGPLYIATQRPYTLTHYEALLQLCAGCPECKLHEIGKSQAGHPLHAFVFEQDKSAPTAYIQSYQHSTEFSGPLVTDAMIRLLLSDEGKNLRRKMNFQFVPAVNFDSLYYGMPLMLQHTVEKPLRIKYDNPNREWADPHWPEVKAIIKFIEQQVAAGTQYAIGLDLHNGWYKADTSGATYTVAAEEEAPNQEYIERQKEFVAFMYENTDHQEPGSFWQHFTGGRTFASNFPRFTGVPAHTVEFSRHIWWDRSKAAYVSARPEFHERFARQALPAIHKFFTD